jgi:F-type H+-transporting ATPase subunit alpha
VDDLPVEAVGRFNDGLRTYLRGHRAILETIRSTGDLTDETIEQLRTVVEEFKQGFQVQADDPISAAAAS